LTKTADIVRIALPLIALASVFSIAGCGIKGPLELPPDAQQASADSSTKSKGKGEPPLERRLPGYQPTSQEQKMAKGLGKPQKPDQPFFLDPLLK
jgi:predicted small lipoprotein YifL